MVETASKDVRILLRMLKASTIGFLNFLQLEESYGYLVAHVKSGNRKSIFYCISTRCDSFSDRRTWYPFSKIIAKFLGYHLWNIVPLFLLPLLLMFDFMSHFRFRSYCCSFDKILSTFSVFSSFLWFTM